MRLLLITKKTRHCWCDRRLTSKLSIDAPVDRLEFSCVETFRVDDDNDDAVGPYRGTWSFNFIAVKINTFLFLTDSSHVFPFSRSAI